MLWNTRIARRQKIVLIGIFSMTVVVMVVAIIRVAISNFTKQLHPDATWIYLWGTVEMATGAYIPPL